MTAKDHWENVYKSKSAEEVSWFQEHPELSLKIIRANNPSPSASIIDVGGGASTLVDDLLYNEYSKITVLDLSISSLEAAKSRLGDRATSVKWIEADILTVDLPANSYDVWHDRAVFHFLTSESDRNLYVQKVLHSVKPGGTVIVATFAEDGPTQCSGLPVRRYSATELHSEFGEPFQLLGCEKELHHTPTGHEQRFVYCFYRKAI